MRIVSRASRPDGTHLFPYQTTPDVIESKVSHSHSQVARDYIVGTIRSGCRLQSEIPSAQLLTQLRNPVNTTGLYGR